MPEPSDDVEASVKRRFARIASDPSSETKFAIGPVSAMKLGYDAGLVASLPKGASESFAGVGNPFSLGTLRIGDIVLDVGCGAGFDALIAASRVGPGGQVIGVDVTPEMVAKSQENARLVKAGNTDFRVGAGEQLPVDSEAIDVVITNGVFNLCVNKPAVVGEFWRVLKPGGRLQMADILLEPHVTPEELASKGTWSD